MTTDIEVSRLVGQELSSVLVATNSIRLQFVKYPLSPSGAFEDSALVEIEHGYEVTQAGSHTAQFLRDGIAEFRNGAGLLLRLIERTVKHASQSSNGDVDLVFDDGSCMRLLVSDEGFEGFHVLTPPAP